MSNDDDSGDGAKGFDYNVLGSLLQASPAFQQYVAKRAVAAANPIVRRVPLQKARAWQISLGPVFGKAGTVTTISVQPQCLFRGEKIIATDTGKKPGTGTIITGLYVGGKSQLGGGLLPVEEVFRVFKEDPDGVDVVEMLLRRLPAFDRYSRRIVEGIARAISTSAFGPNALGSGVKMDTYQPALGIHAAVSFIEACTFDMDIFGKAVV